MVNEIQDLGLNYDLVFPALIVALLSHNINNMTLLDLLMILKNHTKYLYKDCRVVVINILNDYDEVV